MNLNFRKIVFSLLSGMLLSGCSQSGLTLPVTPTHNSGSVAIPTHISTSRATPVPNPTSTATVTTTPPPTATNTEVPTKTLTPIPSPTPYPNTSCNNNEPYTAKWSSFQQGMHFEAFVCPDETFIAVMHDQDIPEYITVNLRGFSQLEYYWGARIDVDSNESTGEQIRYHYIDSKGADWDISLAHWSTGKTDTKLFENRNTFQINVWNNGKMDSWAKMFVDRDNKIMILRGIVPGVNERSRIRFVKFYRTPENKLNFKTNWIDSESSQK